MSTIEATTEDAPAEATEPAEAEPTDAKTRSIPTALEADVKRVCDDYVTGAFAPDRPLTTQVIALQVHANRGNAGNRPSSGAIADALHRWETIGFATVHPKPLAFIDYTEAGRTEGLSALKAAHHDRKAAARAAVRADKKATATLTPTTTAAAPAESAPEVEDEGVPF